MTVSTSTVEDDALARFRASPEGIAARDHAQAVRADTPPYRKPRPSWGYQVPAEPGQDGPTWSTAPVDPDLARSLRQLRSEGGAAPREPVRSNAPQGRSVTSLDTVHKTLRRSEVDAEKHPLHKPSKNGHTYVDRDALDEWVRVRVVKELRRQNFDSQAKRVESCGRILGLRHCLDCAHGETVKTRCGMWHLCPTCCRRRGRQMAAELRQHIELVPRQHKGYRWRLITLPVKTDRDHAAAVDRIGKAFARLWRVFLNPLVKTPKGEKARRLYPGCAAFRSIEFGSLKGNVHLHVIYYGPWVDQAKLSDRWHDITGDSYVTDVRSIDGPKGIAEVAKYAVKMFDTTAKAQVRFWTAIKGKHCTQRYGSLRHSKDKEKGLGETEAFELSCELCGSTRYHYTAVDKDGNIESLTARGPPHDGK